MFQIVILGAGPAGISTAVEAIKKGFKAEEILILEKFDEVAHMIASKYPKEKTVIANYKNKSSEDMSGLRINDMTKLEFMSFMNKTVSDYKLNIKYNQSVDRISKLKNGQLSVQTANNIYLANSLFIAIGTMSTPRSLGVPTAESIAERIFYDIQKISSVDKKVLVVGGGDSAAEFARALIERGHSVCLSYRGNTFEKMLPINNLATLKLVEEKKLFFYPSSIIQKIEDQKGRPIVYFNDSSEGEQFDCIVTALGNERPANYLSSIGIQLGCEGEDNFCATEVEGVFFVGDLASIKSGGTINIAFNRGTATIRAKMYHSGLLR